MTGAIVEVLADGMQKRLAYLLPFCVFKLMLAVRSVDQNEFESVDVARPNGCERKVNVSGRARLLVADDARARLFLERVMVRLFFQKMLARRGIREIFQQLEGRCLGASVRRERNT